MASNFELSGAAIVKAVIETQPSAVNNWRDIKPQTNWGMGPGGWSTFLGIVVNGFNALATPKRIDPEANFDSFRNERLSDLQWALTDKVIP